MINNFYSVQNGAEKITPEEEWLIPNHVNHPVPCRDAIALSYEKVILFLREAEDGNSRLVLTNEPAILTYICSIEHGPFFQIY